MKIAFFSNFLNHHQLPLCEEFLHHGNVDFVFVATEPISQDRLDMGYENMNNYPFVVRAYENDGEKELALKIAKEYDVCIFGASPNYYLSERLKNNKLTFRFCERLFKKGIWRRFIPKTRKSIYNGYTRYKHDLLYILCASAYTSYDLSLCGFPSEKCFKWGYFPKINQVDVNKLLEEKQKKEKVEILYAGRLLKLKRVIESCKAVNKLVKRGQLNFHYTIIGDGEQKNQIVEYINKNNLDNFITILPFMKPEEVREYMDKADIFFFGSNYYEGWGAVVNEALNSGCVLVASHAVGSVPFLIKSNENGLIYRLGDINAICKNFNKLIEDKKLRTKLALKGYETVSQEWTAKNAVERFMRLIEKLQNGQVTDNISHFGPCSPAQIIKNNWIKK